MQRSKESLMEEIKDLERISEELTDIFRAVNAELLRLRQQLAIEESRINKQLAAGKRARSSKPN